MQRVVGVYWQHHINLDDIVLLHMPICKTSLIKILESLTYGLKLNDKFRPQYYYNVRNFDQSYFSFKAIWKHFGGWVGRRNFVVYPMNFYELKHSYIYRSVQHVVAWHEQEYRHHAQHIENGQQQSFMMCKQFSTRRRHCYLC